MVVAGWLRCLMVAAITVAGSFESRAAGPDTSVVLRAGASPDAGEAVGLPGEYDATFPGDCNVFVFAESNAWIEVGSVEIEVAPPSDAPSDIEALLFVEDRDRYWFQNLHKGYLSPGATNTLHFSLEAGEDDAHWEAVNHYGVWNHRSRRNPRQVGVRIFSSATWTGSWKIVSIDAIGARPMQEPPAIFDLTPLSSETGLHECFEVAFRLPDRYENPFDPSEIDAWAEIVSPSGEVCRVDAFYYQDYFRQSNVVADVFVPIGKPQWRFRFAPRQIGEHRYTVHALDDSGRTQSGTNRFSAVSSPDQMPFIRVSEKDPRFFEGDDGSPFFPIGHNIRSPFDTRMDQQFPWKFRHPEGSLAYARYFADMEKAGENITEVWMCSWSLGLEWSADFAGYHGVGDYNLIHAWELDQVLNDARRRGLYVNLSLNNHGRISTFCDSEWQDNPMNKANGGYLDDPLQFFTHPRAIEDTRRQLRYIAARWGWNPAIFAWKLWNELDLTGSGREDPRPHRDPEVMRWLAETAEYLRSLDPNPHMVGCHLSGNYTTQNREMIEIEELDFCPVDAYHHSPDPLYIIGLSQKTAEFNNPFGKPVLITEFGGSPMGTSLDNLKDELRFGLWSSTALPLGGAPMFWWWGVVEEYDLYPEFRSLALYMEDADRRDPDMVATAIDVYDKKGDRVEPERVLTYGMVSARQGFAYVVRPDVIRAEGASPMHAEDWQIELPIEGKAIYKVTFWDIDRARPARVVEVRSESGTLKTPLPSFNRDLAFKIERMVSF